jgi:hypothetical protein
MHIKLAATVPAVLAVVRAQCAGLLPGAQRQTLNPKTLMRCCTYGVEARQLQGVAHKLAIHVHQRVAARQHALHLGKDQQQRVRVTSPTLSGSSRVACCVKRAETRFVWNDGHAGQRCGVGVARTSGGEDPRTSRMSSMPLPSRPAIPSSSMSSLVSVPVLSKQHTSTCSQFAHGKGIIHLHALYA